ncbi:MAG TPA: hypothetical protein VGG02_07035 [Chthoniobacterales bacterium]|jgi:hypothetical protein
MADTSPPNPPTPPSGDGDKKPRKPRGPIDSRTMDELTRDKEIIDATIDAMNSDPQLVTDLSAHCYDSDNTVTITPTSMQALSDQAETALEAGGAAVESTSEFHDATETESADAKKAIAAIRNAQARAKELYEETSPKKLEGWYIGQPLKSRAQITAAGTAIYGLIRYTDDQGNPTTPKETLPNYSHTQIDQFKAQLGTFYQDQTRQSGAQEDASSGRDTFASQAAQVARRRRKVQLAIDAERPAQDDSLGRDNSALRRRLGLPPDKAMS